MENKTNPLQDDALIVVERPGMHVPCKLKIRAVAGQRARLLLTFIKHKAKPDQYTGCFLRPDIKRFCLTFTIGPDRIWFCLIQVQDFFLQ